MHACLMRLRLFYHPGIFLILIVVAIVSYNVFRAPKDPVWDFVHRVLLTWEFRDDKRGIVRWTRPVIMAARSAKPGDLKVLRNLVDDLNLLMKGSGVTVTLGPFDSANAVVIFAPLKKFPALADEFGYGHKKETWGFGVTRHNDKLEITYTISVIPNEATGAERKRLILEEVVQTFGPANDAPQFLDSIFYQSGDYSGEVDRMSDLDRKLVRFLYLHLKPGQDEDAVRRAYEKHWPVMKVPPRREILIP